jgi:hypothetical protein
MPCRMFRSLTDKRNIEAPGISPLETLPSRSAVLYSWSTLDGSWTLHVRYTMGGRPYIEASSLGIESVSSLHIRFFMTLPAYMSIVTHECHNLRFISTSIWSACTCPDGSSCSPRSCAIRIAVPTTLQQREECGVVCRYRPVTS